MDHLIRVSRGSTMDVLIHFRRESLATCLDRTGGVWQRGFASWRPGPRPLGELIEVDVEGTLGMHRASGVRGPAKLREFKGPRRGGALGHFGRGIRSRAKSR